MQCIRQRTRRCTSKVCQSPAPDRRPNRRPHGNLCCHTRSRSGVAIQLAPRLVYVHLGRNRPASSPHRQQGGRGGDAPAPCRPLERIRPVPPSDRPQPVPDLHRLRRQVLPGSPLPHLPGGGGYPRPCPDAVPGLGRNPPPLPWKHSHPTYRTTTRRRGGGLGGRQPIPAESYDYTSALSRG